MKIPKKILIIYLFFSFNISFAQEILLTVLTVNKSKLIQKENNQALIDACDTWCLSKEEVLTFFLNSKRVSSYEKNNFYYFLPCEITGTIERNDTIFDFFINAGATAKLVYEDKVYLYGCVNTTCNKLILMPPDIGNEE